MVVRAPCSLRSTGLLLGRVPGVVGVSRRLDKGKRPTSQRTQSSGVRLWTPRGGDRTFRLVQVRKQHVKFGLDSHLYSIKVKNREKQEEFKVPLVTDNRYPEHIRLKGLRRHSVCKINFPSSRSSIFVSTRTNSHFRHRKSQVPD